MSVLNLYNMMSLSIKLRTIVQRRIAGFTVPVLLFVISFFALTLTSCEPEDLEARNKFIGKWLVEEASSLYDGSTMTFTVNIKASPDDPDEIIISNFYNMNVDAYAYITGNNVTIPRQLICDDTIEVHGSGSYQSNGDIHMTYITDNGADEDTLTAVLTKQ